MVSALPRFLVRTLKIILILFVVLLVWGAAIEPRLVDETHHTMAIPALPSAWEGRSIVLIADLQVGMWLDNTDTIRRIVSRIVQMRPAAVLIAGDFIYNPIEREDASEKEEYEDVDENIREVVEMLSPIPQAKIPVYAVLGNHDYGMMSETSRRNDLVSDRVEKALTAAGIEVLHNRALEREGLHLAGIGSKFARDDDPAGAVAQVPQGAPRIVFMHHPDSFNAVPANAAPLALAAHTHGGQIRIPGFPSWSWLNLTEPGRVPVDGWIDGAGAAGNRLFITRGIGFSRLPIRINCRPELAVFRLQRSSSQ